MIKNSKLQAIAEAIPLLKSVTGTDAAIGVWDSEGVVVKFLKSKSIDVNFEEGYQLQDKNDKIFEVLRTGVQAYNKVPKEAFGMAFEGTITAVKDGSKIIGAITYCFSTEYKEEIMVSAKTLTNALSHTDESINDIKHGTQELASNMTKVQNITDLVREQVAEATKIVDVIQKNAKFSNILALNASIESARAGQAGQGFAVVSEEMRKFSKMSADSAQMINGNLTEIVKSLDSVREAINSSTSIATEQAEAANHLNDKFETVIDSAKRVNQICKDRALL
ncbi:MAG: methyl-accepting chemotaxis protein [bacterium]|nr:methyl-accepting chemotaxis protein [bacterium]